MPHFALCKPAHAYGGHMAYRIETACSSKIGDQSIHNQVLRNKDEKDAKSAAQLHLLHSCLGTPTEQVGSCYVYTFLLTSILSSYTST